MMRARKVQGVYPEEKYTEKQLSDISQNGTGLTMHIRIL